MRIATAFAALLVLGSLAACGDRSDAARRYMRLVNPTTYARWVAGSTVRVVEFVGNTTSTSQAPGQAGTQVEYLAADGGAYRVTPGNTHVDAGEWTTRETPGRGSGTEICVRYPAPGQAATPWTCVDSLQWLLDHDEVRPGDPMGLQSTRTVPEPLPQGGALSVSDGLTLWDRSAPLGADKATW